MAHNQHLSSQKKIILIMPIHFNLYEGVVKNIESIGFKVELLFLSDKRFTYKNFAQRCHNFIRKTFLFDKRFKQTLKDDFHDNGLTNELNKIDKKIDFGIIIRPDFFSTNTILHVKQKVNELVAYQWDGLDRFPKAKNYLNLFDRFYLFDIDDYNALKNRHNNVFPTTNFYLDFEENHLTNSPMTENDIFFIGSYLPNRIDSIIDIGNFFKKLNLKTDINIVYHDKNIPKQYEDTNITFTPTSLTYLEMIEKVKKAAVLLDFANNTHNGLSVRTFESLHYKKKLITNNAIVKNYDFYHPNNIFVWDDNNINDIENFLKLPYQEISKEIIQKYSFTNWLHYILQIPPYQSY